MDLARAPCRAPLTARKMGSGYENGMGTLDVLPFPRPLSLRPGNQGVIGRACAPRKLMFVSLSSS